MTTELPTFHNPVFDRISDEKKETILSIAVEEFAANGLTGTNINKIAEKAGISIGSLYKYFPTKEKLYLSVVNLCFNQLSSELAPVLEANTGLADKIRAIIDLIFDSARRYRSLNRLYNRFTSEGNSKLARTIAERVERITASAYANLLKQAKQENIIDGQINPQIFAFLIDNIFITLQFSLSSNYYQDRMKIFLGEETAGNPGILKQQTFLFICRSLGLQHS